MRTDGELALKTLASDRDAFSQLIERHRRVILALTLQRGIHPSDAENVAQDVFVKAYNSLSHLQDQKIFARWLYGIAEHVIADAAQAMKQRRDEIALDNASSTTASASETNKYSLEIVEILRAVGDLSENQRVTLTLRYLKGLTSKDIAQRLGQSRGVIRSQLHQALNHLQLALNQIETPTSNSPKNQDGGDISCAQSLRQIERMVEENDLKDGERVLLLAHLQSCASCKTVMDRILFLESKLKHAFLSVDTSANFNRRVMDALPPLDPSQIKKSGDAIVSKQNARATSLFQRTDSADKASVAAKGSTLRGAKFIHPVSVIARRWQRSFFKTYQTSLLIAALLLAGLIVAFFKDSIWQSQQFDSNFESSPLPAAKDDDLVVISPAPNMMPTEICLFPADLRIKPDWSATVKDVSLVGKTLTEGLNTIIEIICKSAALLELFAETQKIAGDAKLTFSIHGAMPLKTALTWMARDVGLKFELNANGDGVFRVAGINEGWSAPVNGILPEKVATALKAPLLDADNAPETASDILQFLAERIGVTMICERARLEQPIDLPKEQWKTKGDLLEALLNALQANIAFYDHALFVAAPSKIEALTMVTRHAEPIAAFVGAPPQPIWARDFCALIKQQTYPPPQSALGIRADSHLSGRAAYTDVRLDNEGLRVSCRAGLLGRILLIALLEKLSRPSPLMPNASSILSERAPLGQIADIDQLIKQAQTIIPVERRIQISPFAQQAFANKNLTLGDALEWAAWLSGCGLRKENNMLIVDELSACYGPMELQVLLLTSLVERRPTDAYFLPQTLAALLKELYPIFFENVELRCLKDRLVFIGDRRQLQLAQRLRNELARAIDAHRDRQTFDVKTWRPAWRLGIEQNLSEPLKTNGVEFFSGSFLKLLRQSELNDQLRCAALVDPQAMINHAADTIQFDIKNASIGQALERLAKGARLKMRIEGQVIWFRP